MRWLGVCVCVCVWSHNAVLFLRVLPSVTLAQKCIPQTVKQICTEKR